MKASLPPKHPILGCYLCAQKNSTAWDVYKGKVRVTLTQQCKHSLSDKGNHRVWGSHARFSSHCLFLQVRLPGKHSLCKIQGSPCCSSWWHGVSTRVLEWQAWETNSSWHKAKREIIGRLCGSPHKPQKRFKHWGKYCNDPTRDLRSKS